MVSPTHTPSPYTSLPGGDRQPHPPSLDQWSARVSHTLFFILVFNRSQPHPVSLYKSASQPHPVPSCHSGERLDCLRTPLASYLSIQFSFFNNFLPRAASQPPSQIRDHKFAKWMSGGGSLPVSQPASPIHPQYSSSFTHVE